MMAEVQERLKLKRTTLDVWSTKEKLSLASLVQSSGDQNWSCVSRSIRVFAEPNRPPDWFSPKNCAQQYASLLENVETPKRKKRVAGSGEKSEVETPGESIVRKLKADRIEELKLIMEEIRAEYLKRKEISHAVISGDANDKLQLLLQEIEDEKKKKELEKEAHIKWLKEREERKIELERAWKPGSRLMNIRRASSISEPSSEADSPLSEPLNVDVPEESVLTKPTPTSPLLTSLLKSPSTVSQSVTQNNSSILHSAITSPHRGSSPTIASLLSSSPGLPGNFAMPPSNVSPNLKNLVSNAIASSFNEEHKVLPQSPSQGAPTLSMLLELPPSLPGKPLPMLKPQPSAPPPYSEHLGPPPPYSQATEYLQKQRAEQMAVQSQTNILKQTPPKEEEPKSGATTPTTDVNRIMTTPPSTGQAQSVTSRRGSFKGRRLDLQSENETEETVTTPEVPATPPKASPAKEKDAKRILHNTSDHDYVETPAKEKEKSPTKSESRTPKKMETDVFEFDEFKDGSDDLKESKMSYLKSNAQRLAMKKEAEANSQKKTEGSSSSPNKNPEPKSYLRESEKGSAVKENKNGTDEDIPLRDLAKKELVFDDPSDESSKKESEAKTSPVKSSPVKETESRRSSRSSFDGLDKKEPEVTEVKEVTKRKSTGDEAKETINEKEIEIETAVEIAPQDIKIDDEDSVQKERRKSSDLGEKSEEEKEEEQEDMEATKDDDASHLTDVKSEKADLSTTEDEKSNDAPPRVYSRRRGAASASFSDSVPNSPAPITEEEKEYKTWKKSVMLVYTRLAGHKFASLFLKPITDDQAPGYSDIVKRPMDLSTVKRNIEFGHIRTTSEFQRDVMLMFMNALMYNESDHDVYAMAKEMQADCLEHIQLLQQATDESTPSRRETRTQQSLDVKVRTIEKPAKVPKAPNPVPPEVEKPPVISTPEPKTRPNRLSVKNTPAGRPKVPASNEKQTPASRKRSMAAQGNESGKKRSKVED